MRHDTRPANDTRGEASGFRLIASVKRGIGSDFDEVSKSYATVEAARIAGKSLGQNERIAHVLIARDDVPPTFVEWVA